MGYKKKFIISNPFALLIINVKIMSNLKKEWCTFGKENGCLNKKNDCSFLRFECFEHEKTF